MGGHVGPQTDVLEHSSIGILVHIGYRQQGLIVGGVNYHDRPVMNYDGRCNFLAVLPPARVRPINILIMIQCGWSSRIQIAAAPTHHVRPHMPPI